MTPNAAKKISYIGNIASLGAKLALLSIDEREYAEDLRMKTEHIDLSMDPKFMDEFSEAMIFPTEDLFKG